MLKKIIAASVVASTLAVVGCAGNPHTSKAAQDLAALQDKDWILTQIGDVAYKVDATAGNSPSLKFSNLALSGSDGCNRIMGGYAVQGTSLKLSELATTKMMCLNATDLPQRFTEALGRVEGYKVTDTQLQLLDSNKKPIVQFKTK
ncbi:heat shock protein HslJ [Acinetobacter calcoaceticus]|uniref:Heat shock protein HslJ n=1 Tax=Acinetobacter calcoaceticus TaxID=471 RepID=A0A4R1XIL7_ACICA|nr:heat shock protein HslJ [Acinetobacter calcoaceticus]